jgi:hypothetical protein
MGGKAFTVELENGKEIKLYPNKQVSIIRDGVTQKILAKDLKETDDFLI